MPDTVSDTISGPMSDTASNAVLDFLAARRSVAPKVIREPAPGRDELARLLTIAARVPDHGMMVPFRFVVLGKGELRRIADEIARIGEAAGMPAEKTAKGRAIYTTSPLAVAVVSRALDGERIPKIEQINSAACACLQLLNAALASGWAAGWVTGWAAHDRRFLPALLGFSEDEAITGIVHIGTGPAPGSAQEDRRRPDVQAITDWRLG